MMIRFVAVAIGCLLVGYSVGQAQQKYTAYGYGKLSCAEWTGRNANRRDPGLEAWALGFVSGASYASTVRVRPTSADGISGWIDKHCEANQFDGLAQAGEKLVTALRSR